MVPVCDTQMATTPGGHWTGQEITEIWDTDGKGGTWVRLESTGWRRNISCSLCTLPKAWGLANGCIIGNVYPGSPYQLPATLHSWETPNSEQTAPNLLRKDFWELVVGDIARGTTNKWAVFKLSGKMPMRVSFPRRADIWGYRGWMLILECLAWIAPRFDNCPFALYAYLRKS